MNLRFPLITFIIIVMTSCTSTTVSEEEEFFDNNITLLADLSAQEQALFNMVNDYRVDQGLDKLEYSPETYKYALEHNEYMISKGELSHENFNERASQISKTTSANFIAENVAKDYQLIDDALQGWLNSSSHLSTIKGDFTHSALSIKQDADGNPYYTHIFLRK